MASAGSRGHEMRSDEPQVRTRILDGTASAIGRHGLRKLGMSDIAIAAGVSRGTLYRYFASRDELLEALFDHERHRFQSAANDLLSDVPAGIPRLEAHVHFVLDYLRGHPALPRLIETEPRYGLSFLEAHYPSFRNATAAILEPIVSSDGGLLDDLGVSLEVLSDLLLRVLISFFLFRPSPDVEEDALLSLVSIISALARRPVP